MATLSPGAIIDGRYAIVALLGQGDAGVVYKARHQLMNRIVAVRMLPAELSSNQEALEIFRQEAKSVSALNHSGIVSVHDFGVTAEGQAYLVTDFLEGASLADLLSAQEPLAWQKVVSIFCQVCAVLAYAHKRGVMHRDLRPNNIILTDSGSNSPDVKVTDFFVGKSDRPSIAESQQLLSDSQARFILPYMSPEQILGRAIDQRADIYSLGCVIYQCLAGKPPLLGRSAAETVSMQLSLKPSSFNQLRADLQAPPWLEPVVLKALEKDVEKRWQSMSELSDELSKHWSDSKAEQSTVKSTKHMLNGAAAPSTGKRPSLLSIATFCVAGAVVIACSFALYAEFPCIRAWTALKFAEQKEGASPQAVLAAMRDLQGLYENRHRYAEATDLGLRVLALSESTTGKTSDATLEAEVRLANLFLKQGRTAEASQYCRKAFKVIERSISRESKNSRCQVLLSLSEQLLPVLKATAVDKDGQEQYARALGLAGDWSLRLGDPKRAKVFLEAALAVHKGLKVSRREDRYWALLTLASVYTELEQYPEAERLYELATNQFVERFGLRHPYTAQCFHNFAFCYSRQKKYSQAVECMKKTISVDETAGEIFQSKQLLPSLEQLLGFMDVAGLKAEREPICLRQIKLETKLYGQPRDATLLRLVGIYYDQGKKADCERVLSDVLARLNRQGEHADPQALNRLGIYYGQSRQIALAVDAFKRAAASARTDPRCSIEFVAQVLYQLAVAQAEIGRYQEAEQSFKESLIECEKVPDGARPLVVAILTGRADCSTHLNNQAMQVEFLKQAVELIDPSRVPPDDSHFARVLKLTSIYREHQQFDAIAKLLKKLMTYCNQHPEKPDCVECRRQYEEALSHLGKTSKLVD